MRHWKRSYSTDLTTCDYFKLKLKMLFLMNCTKVLVIAYQINSMDGSILVKRIMTMLEIYQQKQNICNLSHTCVSYRPCVHYPNSKHDYRFRRFRKMMTTLTDLSARFYQDYNELVCTCFEFSIQKTDLYSNVLFVH